MNLPEYQKNYEDNLNLYQGKAYNVFPPNQFGIRSQKIAKEVYLQKNYFKIITDTFTNLSVYEHPIITLSKNQTTFDDWRKDNNFDFFIKRVFQKGSIAGDCIAVIDFSIITEDQNVTFDNYKIKIIPNDIWTPYFDEYNPDEEAKLNCLEYKYTIKTNDQKDVYTVKKFFEYNGEQTRIYFEVYKENEKVESIPKEIKDKFYIEQLEARDYPFKVFHRFVNEKPLEGYFGVSDYTDNVKSYVREINAKLELEALVDRKTSDPATIVPDDYFSSTTKKASEIAKSYKNLNNQNQSLESFNYVNENKNLFGNELTTILSKQMLLKGLEYFPVKEGQTAPYYLESQNTIERIETTIKRLKQELAEDVALPLALLDSEKKIGALSGSAIQKSIQSTLFKKKARELNMIEFLSDILFAIFGETPTIQFQDGITDDPAEKATLASNLYNNGLISQKEAVKRANNLTDEQAEEMLKEINNGKNLTKNENGVGV